MVFLFGSQLKIVKDSGSVSYLCGDQIPDKNCKELSKNLQIIVQPWIILYV